MLLSALMVWMLGFPMDRWETVRLDMLIWVLVEWSIKISPKSIWLSTRIRSKTSPYYKKLSKLPKKTRSNFIFSVWFRTEAYMPISIISKDWFMLPSLPKFPMSISMPLPMVAMLIPNPEQDLSRSCKKAALPTMLKSHRSLDATMRWIVTSGGSASKKHMTYWFMVKGNQQLILLKL